jgi:hypothetical protein
MATIHYTEHYNELGRFSDFFNEYYTKIGEPLHPVVLQTAYNFIRNDIRGTVELGGVSVQQFKTFGDLLHKLRLSSDEYPDLQSVEKYARSDEYIYQYDRVLITNHDRIGLYSLIVVDDYSINQGDE